MNLAFNNIINQMEYYSNTPIYSLNEEEHFKFLSFKCFEFYCNHFNISKFLFKIEYHFLPELIIFTIHFPDYSFSFRQQKLKRFCKFYCSFYFLDESLMDIHFNFEQFKSFFENESLISKLHFKHSKILKSYQKISNF